MGKQNCEKQAEASGYHYFNDTGRCQHILKGSKSPCNRGYRNENICIQRCLKMNKTEYAGPTLDLSLQKDYDEMIKWSTMN